MDLGISGRKAIVNGGSSGLGRGSALALAREGVQVFVSARGEARLLTACEEIAKIAGAPVTPVVADHSTQAGQKTILAACPQPDIVVNTSTPPEGVDDYRKVSTDDWQKNLKTAFLGPVLFMQTVIDGMASRGFGRIVNIGTGAAKFPNEVRLMSGVPRAALANYSVAIARKVARDNVCINNILPGMHDTSTIIERFSKRAEENGVSYEEEVQAYIDEWKIPANRFGDPEHFGALVAMLCSEQAGFLTGQSLVVDGGVHSSTF